MGATGPRHALTARRDELCMSVDQLARLVGVDRRTVYRWERGAAVPYRRQYRALADALGVTVEQLEQLLTSTGGGPHSPAHGATTVVGLMPSDWTADAAAAINDAAGAGAEHPMSAEAALRLAHMWLVTDPPHTVQLAAGRRVGARLAQEATARVAQLRRLDDHIAGDDLQPAVVRDLVANTTALAHGSYTDQVGRQLLTVVGDLCQLAGRTAADMHDDRAAAHYLATGTSAAHAAGDVELAAECLSTLAYHVANTGQAGDAVLLAQSAVAGSRHVPGATSRAVRLDRLAWAHARAHDRSQTERALGRAQEAFAGRRAADEPDWAYWVTVSELEVMEGRCFTELGQPDLARPKLEPVLDPAGWDRPREAALYMSWLAEAEVQARNIDRAAYVAGLVLDLAGRTRSGRAADRVHHLAELLEPHGSVAVGAFLEAYRESLVGWSPDPDPPAAP